MYIFRKTLLDYRRSVAIWGIGLALLMLTVGTAYNGVIGGPDKVQQIASLQKIANSFAFLIGKAYDLDTFGGFVTTRYMGVVPVLLAIFALLAGNALIRGEEEQGSLDLLLSTPHSRATVYLQKWAGLVVALAAICALCWLGLIAGAATGGLQLDAGATAVAFLNTFLISLFFGTMTMAFGQLFSRKVAAGWTSGLLAATYFMHTSSQQLPGREWLGFLSPFYYYNLSKPLARSVGTDWPAMALLAVIVLPVLAAGLMMYLNRDHNSYFRLWTTTPSKNTRAVYRPGSTWLKNNFTFSLGQTLPGTLVWTAGLSFYIVFMVLSVPSLRESIETLLSGELFKNLGFLIDSSVESLLQLLLFVSIMVLFVAYAVTLVAGWSGEELQGRLELVLSTPLPRWRILLGRFLATQVALVLLVFLTWLSCWLACNAAGLVVKQGNLAAAFFGLWVVCSLVVAVGFGLSAWNPGPAAGILGGLVIVSYLLDLLGTVLRLPVWVQDLSVFRQYGKPVVTGPNWPSLLVMLLLIVVFVGLAVFRFEKRDVVK
jgi:ABC-2 type transport system permease protein